MYEEPTLRPARDPGLPDTDDLNGGGDADLYVDKSANSSPRHGSESESESEGNHFQPDSHLHILIDMV